MGAAEEGNLPDCRLQAALVAAHIITWWIPEDQEQPARERQAARVMIAGTALMDLLLREEAADKAWQALML